MHLFSIAFGLLAFVTGKWESAPFVPLPNAFRAHPSIYIVATAQSHGPVLAGPMRLHGAGPNLIGDVPGDSAIPKFAVLQPALASALARDGWREAGAKEMPGVVVDCHWGISSDITYAGPPLDQINFLTRAALVAGEDFAFALQQAIRSGPAGLGGFEADPRKSWLVDDANRDQIFLVLRGYAVDSQGRIAEKPAWRLSLTTPWRGIKTREAFDVFLTLIPDYLGRSLPGPDRLARRLL